ncbi:hypothetical protein M8542_35985 [Amycolatopsis sp. OK19-0408]|uniref:Uncharacterized protein n=1 Tax=Amycolatopsis iheyensis TaxID=2945988 RepID=A0A9X2SN17_9PSEU|nr:hypothetical protein [Amycolatopsis iheyensis]MCR6488244.1 hypothetical protein [Amycolatopsis iheyensis]
MIDTPGPVDIGVLPEVVAALRRHRDHTTSYVVHVAIDAWDRAHRYDLLGRRQ